MDDILIKKATNQPLTLEEELKLEQWLRSDKNNHKILNQVKLALHAPLSDQRQAPKQEVWQDIVNRVESKDHADRPAHSQDSWWGQFLRAAAVLVIAALVGVVIYQYKEVRPGQAVVEVKWIEKESLKGQKLAFTLPDGTRVRLNAGSKILTPESFTGAKRQVSLVGEAFFEVTEDPSKPFYINTEEVTVKVLGTSFNVKAYPLENDIRVAVATGKVSVKGKDTKENAIQLKPGLMTAFSKTTRTFSTEEFDWESELGWKDNSLVFKEARVSRVIYELSKWYGVEFILEKELDNNKDFTAHYKNPTLTAVLDGLSFVYDFDYEIRGDEVIIK